MNLQHYTNSINLDFFINFIFKVLSFNVIGPLFYSNILATYDPRFN